MQAKRHSLKAGLLRTSSLSKKVKSKGWHWYDWYWTNLFSAWFCGRLLPINQSVKVGRYYTLWTRPFQVGSALNTHLMSLCIIVRSCFWKATTMLHAPHLCNRIPVVLARMNEHKTADDCSWWWATGLGRARDSEWPSSNSLGLAFYLAGILSPQNWYFKLRIVWQ